MEIAYCLYFLENMRENNPVDFGSASCPLHRADAGTPRITC
ncbi:hypothetical protein G9444_6559 (plasmid) [Rhodococcus erythropolis]|uniref:Uncharacterized protein n=1 Tax=Rhodococcus erythropolis TaxID=1833 RepID=A0A6G9D3Y4_RHOER|nr:hypothetical protein G9444_6559 [Rhodococcus erythropolis]